MRNDAFCKAATVQFGSVTVCAGNGSSSSSFLVRMVPPEIAFSLFLCLVLTETFEPRPPNTGVLDGKFSGSALASAPRVTVRNQRALLVLLRVLRKLGVPQAVLPRVLTVGREQEEHPRQQERPREHSLAHPQFS